DLPARVPQQPHPAFCLQNPVAHNKRSWTDMLPTVQILAVEKSDRLPLGPGRCGHRQPHRESYHHATSEWSQHRTLTCSSNYRHLTMYSLRCKKSWQAISSKTPLDRKKRIVMAGQGIERREILRYIGIASVASAFPGFRQWTFACSHGEHAAGHAAAQASSQPYKPLFLSPEQFGLVEHLTDLIIPGDDSPGAKEAGVAEFIDFMLAHRVAVTAAEDAR